MRATFFFNMTCLISGCVLAACSTQISSTGPLEKKNSSVETSSISIDTLIGQGITEKSISLSQTIQINLKSSPKWKVIVGRKDKNSTVIHSTENGTQLTLTFNRIGYYEILVESLPNVEMTMAPNLIRYPLKLQVRD
ncbi:hypothetical protein [Aliikangiella sp. G2MR2-5]|uniref:hypothetical protein n=1 Tax=Aliikangiella sp. G2MR2-5 TaxID=2788943 RepID=UPI0018AB0FB8|nr:hypothetical protein [Aliikangiella sp. G2MR2-5]